MSFKSASGWGSGEIGFAFEGGEREMRVRLQFGIKIFNDWTYNPNIKFGGGQDNLTDNPQIGGFYWIYHGNMHFRIAIGSKNQGYSDLDYFRNYFGF